MTSNIPAPTIGRSKYLLLHLSNPRKKIEDIFENISLLLDSGMDIITALKILREEATTYGTKILLDVLITDTENGYPLSSSLQRLAIVPSYALSLVATGEQSGRLSENIKVLVDQQIKARELKSKVLSALAYPGLVFAMTIIVGFAMLVFVFPMISSVLSSLRIELPTITKSLIAIGAFMKDYGISVAAGSIILLLGAFFALFGLQRTRLIGLGLLFYIPIIRPIIRESEVTRFGFILGSLLEAGMPITQSLEAMKETTQLFQYYNLYTHIAERIATGDSFKQSFASYRKSYRYFPVTVQHMIMSGERSGRLGIALLTIAKAYEVRTDRRVKTLGSLIEPLVLMIVGVAVLLLAVGILFPIYSIIGNLR